MAIRLGSCWTALACNGKEFASRIGVTAQDLTAYLPKRHRGLKSASLMIRMRRLSDRFRQERNPYVPPTLSSGVTSSASQPLPPLGQVTRGARAA